MSVDRWEAQESFEKWVKSYGVDLEFLRELFDYFYLYEPKFYTQNVGRYFMEDLSEFLEERGILKSGDY